MTVLIRFEFAFSWKKMHMIKKYITVYSTHCDILLPLKCSACEGLIDKDRAVDADSVITDRTNGDNWS